MEIGQIKNANYLFTADFYPKAPIVDRERETANKTTIVIYKPVENSPLYFVDPNTKELELCEPINTDSVSYELNARDATNPFRVLVAYNYTTKQIIIRQGTAAASPETPELQAGELLIATLTEQAQGQQQTEPEPVPTTNYFRCKQLTKATGTYSDIIDFSYSKVFLTITGNITISNPATDLTGDFLPDGKTLLLYIKGSANTISWGTNFVQTDNSIAFSTSATKWNRVIVTKNELSGKYEYTNTDTVTV